MRILVIRFSSLGDVVLAAGPLRALSAIPGETRITFVTKEAYATLYDHFDCPVDIVAAPPQKTLGAVRKQLRGERFEWIIDLHGSIRSRLLARLVHAGNRVRVAKNVRRRRDMVRYKAGLDHPIATLAVYHDAAAHLYPNTNRPLPQLCLSDDETDAARRMATDSGPCIGLGWGARWPTKYVPPDLWTRLLTALSPDYKGAVRIFGMTSDRAAIEAFASTQSSQHPGIDVHIECGHNLREAMVRLRACDVFVSSDSGLMHVADALGVPAFGVFGPTHPSLGFAPAGERSRAFHSGIWCSPCHRHGAAPCHRGQRFCFDELDAGPIATAILATLNAKGTPA